MAMRARGEGTIYRRKDGTFEGRLSVQKPDGQLGRKSFYAKTRMAVADAMRAYRASRGKVELSRITLAEYLASWLSALDVRPNTFRQRHHLITNHIVPHLGGRPLCELTSDDVRYLLLRWKDDGVGAPTQRAAYLMLSAALSVAVREEKINRNPCGTVPAPKIKRPEVRVLDGPQAFQLLRAADDLQEAALMTLAVTTGMRQGELFALFWEDVDLKSGTVSVRKTLTEDLDGNLRRTEPKTKKSLRTIHLTNLAIAALSAWRKAQEEPLEGFVFHSSDGTPLRKSNFVRRVFKPLLKRAELPMVTFHSLRHTATSLLIEAGEDPLAIAGSLGHSDTRMIFERYGHLFSHTAKRVAQTTNRIFDELEANCRKTVVEGGDRVRIPDQRKTRNRNNDAGFQLVEMRRLELLTPYMRSKCSTS